MDNRGWKVETFKKYIYGPFWMYISNFNILAQFGGEIRNEKEFFEVKKVGIDISSFLIDLGAQFFDMLNNFWFSIDWLEKRQILRFWSLSTPSLKFGYNWILTHVHPQSYIPNPPPNWADWPNWSDFDKYQVE